MIRMIEKEIEIEFNKGTNLSKKSTRKKIYDRLEKKIVMTPTAPVQDINYRKLQDNAITQTRDRFEQKYYEKLRNDLYLEAVKTYPLLKSGDIVTIFYRDKGKQASVTGKLFNIHLYENVSVDNTVVSFIDMDETQQQLFTPKSVENLRRQYIEKKIIAMEKYKTEAKMKYLREQYLESLEQIFAANEKNGYIYQKQDKEWWTPRFTFLQYLNKYAVKQKAIARKKINQALAELGVTGN